MMDTMEVVGNEVLMIWYIAVDSLCILNFELSCIFVHNTTRGSCIKVTILVCDWCQAMFANSVYGTSFEVPVLSMFFLSYRDACYFDLRYVKGLRDNI